MEHMESCQVSVSAAVLLLFLSVLGQTLAVAPGDESGECGVPDYPANIKVLLDSWRYQTLLPDTWTATNSDPNNPGTWYSAGGTCENSAVAVCSGHRGDKFLDTQVINKSLPAPDVYDVRVFVNITYSFMGRCPEERSSRMHDDMENCDDYFELLFETLGNYESVDRHYRKDGIEPDNRISDSTLSGTQHFYFDSTPNNDRFALRLRSRGEGVCVTVSRVLVYRHECPGHDRLSTGLTHRPATQAAIDRAVPVTPYCAENSHHSEFSRPDVLICIPEGLWLNDQTQCVCDQRYDNQDDPTKCKASPILNMLSTSEVPTTPTTISPNPSSRVSPAETHTVSSIIAKEPKKPASKTIDKIGPILSSIGTPGGGSDGGGAGTSVVLGAIGGLIAVVIVFILVVILLIIVLLRKNRSGQKDSDKHLDNPVYNAVTQSIELKQHPTSTTTNGNGMVHKQDGETLRRLSNPLYVTTHDDSESQSNNSAYFDEPQYSLPSASGTATTTAEYEIPVTSPTQSQATPTTTPPPPLPHVYDYAVVTSPTESQATPTTTPPPSLPPHVYDYAAVPPSSTAPPEYAVLEPPGHMYHCLEFPGPPEPAERSCEGQGTEQTVVESEYSVIGQN